ncbi:MAG: glycosyltransferase [Microthrixaceae bacterium]|nr:glycosyltransferase [Microthrixaceae bacterium]
MNLLRRVLVIGVLATLVDVVGFVVLVEAFGWRVWVADGVAVAAATLVSYFLHTARTFSPGAPSRRWFESHGRYWGTALAALLTDVGVIVLLDLVVQPNWWLPLLALKSCSLGVAFLVRSLTYRDLMFHAVRDAQSVPACRQTPEGAVRLSVVVPAYREADRIAAGIGRIRADLAAVADAGGLEVVVVDDGSGDGTAEAARDAGADQVISYAPNRGKGAAVRQGMLAAKGRTVAFTDADLSYSPAQITRLLEAVEAGWDVVVGSRRHTATMTVVRAGRLRELGGRVINVFTGVVLLGRYRDTQCGLKAFRGDVARLVFANTTVDGFAFDVEVFHLVERYRLTLTEVPVEVENSQRSTVSVVRDAARLIVDLVSIRNNDRTGVYDVAEPALPPSRAGGSPGGLRRCRTPRVG